MSISVSISLTVTGTSASGDKSSRNNRGTDVAWIVQLIQQYCEDII